MGRALRRLIQLGIIGAVCYIAWRLISARIVGEGVAGEGVGAGTPTGDDEGSGALRLVQGLRAEGNSVDLVELDLVDVDGVEAAVAVLDVDGVEVDVVEVDGTIELVAVEGVEVDLEPDGGGPAPADPFGSTDPAWVLPEADGSCPIGFAVKAKLASGIFHVPGATNYDRTRPDRCYSSAAAAELDGLRPPKR
jgi:hypothetical protein